MLYHLKHYTELRDHVWIVVALYGLKNVINLQVNRVTLR